MIGMTEILVVLVIILILFGPKKLPELARSIGESVKAYREGMSSKGKKKKLKG
ncbi:twin-arginine translocase TatA/TatE family subunit [Candidatus Woesearchaeota archaeon]|nr:twin-arginine translocase TatA/TatE family subunit [Candidatus Woesearchaeota archaeon]